MKNHMTKILLMFASLAITSLSVFGQATESTFVSGATGTTSATAFIPAGNSVAEVRDLSYRLDAGVTSGTVDIRTPKLRMPITSATSASGTTLWFTNTGSAIVAQGDYVIFEDASTSQGASTYYLYRAKTVTSTSITTVETITPATALTDSVYPLNTAVRRPAPPVNSTTSANHVSIWLPAGMPSALTLDGNTTSCQLEVSGVRGNSK